MYVDPFWFGVFCTITFELLAILLFVLCSLFKHFGKKGDYED